MDERVGSGGKFAATEEEPVSGEDQIAWEAEKIAMHVEAAGMARSTRHSYDDCLAGLTLLALIRDQVKRDAMTRICVEAARSTAYSFSFSDIARGMMQAAGMSEL